MSRSNLALRTRLASSVTLIGVLLTLGMPTAAQSQAAAGLVSTNCDRACLEGLIDDYLAAIITHDPSRLPLSRDVTYTEDKRIVEVGDGFWQSATARGNYNHYFADTVMAQAGWLGTTREGDTSTVCSARRSRTGSRLPRLLRR